jgi:hypothetical protein
MEKRSSAEREFEGSNMGPILLCKVPSVSRAFALPMFAANVS